MCHLVFSSQLPVVNKTEEIEWGRRDCLLLAHSGIAVRVGEANTSRWSRSRDRKKKCER